MISIILPTYNERKNISILIPKIESFFKEREPDFEIIVVDDNSPDGTAHLSLALNKKYKNIRTIIRGRKEGIGAAIREGYNAGKGDILISSDADLSFEVGDMLRLIERMRQGYDLVVGSRHTNNTHYERGKVKTRVKWITSFYGNKLISFVSGVKIHDFSANFRAIKRDVWNKIETKEKTNAILMEMIIKAKNKGFRITEIPVSFKDRVYGKSKLNLIREAPKFFFKLVTISFKAKLSKKACGERFKVA